MLILIHTISCIILGFAIGWRWQLTPLIHATVDIVMRICVGPKIEDHHVIDEIAQTLQASKRYAGFLLMLAAMRFPCVRHAVLTTRQPRSEG